MQRAIFTNKWLDILSRRFLLLSCVSWIVGLSIIFVLVELFGPKSIIEASVKRALKENTEQKVFSQLNTPRNIGEVPVETLLELMKNNNQAIRRAASHALCRSPKRDHVDEIMAFSDDPDINVRANCLIAVAQIGNKKALTKLYDVYKNNDKTLCYTWIGHVLGLGGFREVGDDTVSKLATVDGNLLIAYLYRLNHMLFMKGFTTEPTVVINGKYICSLSDEESAKEEITSYKNEIINIWNIKREEYRTIWSFKEGDPFLDWPPIDKYEKTAGQRIFLFYLVKWVFLWTVVFWVFVLAMYIGVFKNYRDTILNSVLV